MMFEFVQKLFFSRSELRYDTVFFSDSAKLTLVCNLVDQTGKKQSACIKNLI